MSRKSIVGSGLLAVVLLSAMFASAATAAEPTWKVCYSASPKDSGHYSSSSCTAASKVEAGGKYELGGLEHAKKTTLKASGKTASFILDFEGKFSADVIECKSSSTLGHYGKAESVWYLYASTEFKSCKGGTGESCPNIKLAETKSRLVYLSKSPLTVGLLTTTASGGPLASFPCEGGESVWSGSLLSTVEPANTISAATTVKAKTKSNFEEEYQTYEGSIETPNVLVWSIHSAFDYTVGLTDTLTFKGEKVEIEA